MKVGYYSPAFLEKQARALVTMEVLWRADPDLWEPGWATAPATRLRCGCPIFQDEKMSRALQVLPGRGLIFRQADERRPGR